MLWMSNARHNYLKNFVQRVNNIKLVNSKMLIVSAMAGASWYLGGSVRDGLCRCIDSIFAGVWA